VILNQLTFGDKIESKDATKLPCCSRSRC